MADIEELKKLMVFVRDQMCHKTDCMKCDYNNPDGICYSISNIMRNALSVIEQMEQEIERLKPRKAHWITKTCDALYCSNCDAPSICYQPYCCRCGAEMEKDGDGE